MVNVFFVGLCLMLVEMGSSKISTREQNGYPIGFLSDCPGSTKEAKISRKSLFRLKFLLIGEGNYMRNKTEFNYFHMKDLARHLDFSKKTLLYMNGYLDTSYVFFVSPAMASMYRRKGYNALVLEYWYFTAMVYPTAARFLRPVGKHAAEMLAELTKYGLDPKKLEILGISHGGQGISFIAKNFQKITGTKISRVTALDPSGPCFRNLGPEDRIDASDGDFVDIIHTNIDGYGMAAPVGHVDFYVNGGEYQPGDFKVIPCTNVCSHSRAFTLWIGALLNPKAFIGMQCDSVQDARDRNCFDRKPFVTNLLGPKTDRNKTGIFYLMSFNIFPYSMGERGLKKENEVYNLQMASYNSEAVMQM